MRELIHEETVDGFVIRFHAHEEDESPRGQFTLENGEDDEELLKDIAAGRYAWFAVECTASKCGVELATDWLGCCCYETYADFMTPDGYAADMRATVIAEAHEVIACLSA